jgi:TRAP-type C4-dicarboxylate transport system substrate-binding protein
MKLLALNRHMGPQRLCGAFRLARAQRLDDRLVLGHGLRQPPAPAQLQSAKRLEPPMQAQRLLFEKAIASLMIDNMVKPLVFTIIPIGIAALDRRTARGIGIVQLFQCRIRYPHCRQTPADALYLGHGFEHFHQFNRPRLADKDAAARDLLGQTRGDKPLQGLADRGARHIELRRQAQFIKPVTIVKAAGKNQLFQRIRDYIRPTKFHIKNLAAGLVVRKVENIVYKKLDSEFKTQNTDGTCSGHLARTKWEEDMKKSMFTAAVAAGMMLLGSVANAKDLRLSHQWSNSDVRHKVAQIVADEVAAADVDLEIKIFGSKSLFKPREQYTPLSRGQLDMTVLPLSYAGGQQPSYNLTLMPGLVKNHDHAARLSNSPFMEALEAKMAEDDVMVLVHGYLAGGFAGKDKCITKPDDIKGLQTRAAGKAFEQMLAGAGASIASMASSEIYNAMQTGVLDAANTSSSSFVSYRIYEQVKCYTPAGDVALWFMYQPLLMNKSTFEGLTEAQQAALLAGAEKAEAFYLEEAKKEDANSVEVFKNAGVEIAQMSDEDFAAWRAIATETSYKAFVESVPDGQALLDMALAVE